MTNCHTVHCSLKARCALSKARGIDAAARFCNTDLASSLAAAMLSVAEVIVRFRNSCSVIVT